jgi:type III secretory pathway component EscS
LNFDPIFREYETLFNLTRNLSILLSILSLARIIAGRVAILFFSKNLLTQLSEKSYSLIFKLFIASTCLKLLIISSI